ncbi:MAG: inner membrane CreD family protein [candidate division WOR-3 bacterium]
MKKLPFIFLIYVLITAAWFILGATILKRTHTQDFKLKGMVGQLWGTMQVQKAPYIYYQTEEKKKIERVEDGKKIEEYDTYWVSHSLPLKASEIDVSLSLNHRRKGLLWYSTYAVGFSGWYEIINDTYKARYIYFNFDFPAAGAVYDDFKLLVNEKEIEKIDISSGSVVYPVRLSPGETETIEVSYNSQGLDQWWYDFGQNVTQVKDFILTMNTDFERIDFPQNSISPTQKTKTKDGWELKWKYSNLLTGVKIGMDLPRKLNPGPWVSQVTFSAPVSLFLFFFLLFIFTTLRGIKIHPMNYFFIGAAFFGFHLLLAYLVDHISIHAAFLISSVVSIALVVTYMRLVVSNRFAFVEVAIAQFVYLVLFSYTFFFEGFTGLAITILCIVTLFVVMQFTGKVDWEAMSKKE